jgi:hypothetical protein
MQPESDILTQLAAQWRIDGVSPSLAGRIIAHARSLPQEQPFGRRLMTALAHAFSEWNYAFAYKTAALAAIAMLGVATAQLGASDTDNDPLNAANTSWTEAL